RLSSRPSFPLSLLRAAAAAAQLLPPPPRTAAAVRLRAAGASIGHPLLRADFFISLRRRFPTELLRGPGMTNRSRLAGSRRPCLRRACFRPLGSGLLFRRWQRLGRTLLPAAGLT
ncbi:unnamed protein product, partial [Ectocarpus sp. 12 AP-2014]